MWVQEGIYLYSVPLKAFQWSLFLINDKAFIYSRLLPPHGKWFMRYKSLHYARATELIYMLLKIWPRE